MIHFLLRFDWGAFESTVPGRASSVCPTMVAACAGPPMHLFFLVRMHPGVSLAVSQRNSI